MAYFTLVTNLDNEPGQWEIEFGDYNKECVEFERDDICEHGMPKRCTKIIRTQTARQSEINAAIAKLNEKGN